MQTYLIRAACFIFFRRERWDLSAFDRRRDHSVSNCESVSMVDFVDAYCARRRAFLASLRALLDGMLTSSSTINNVIMYLEILNVMFEIL